MCTFISLWDVGNNALNTRKISLNFSRIYAKRYLSQILLILMLSTEAYFPILKIVPLDRRYRGLDRYPDEMPACTLNIKINKNGASGYLDAHFKASNSYPFSGDSLEVYSVLTLPRELSVDSMVLWIYGEPEPAEMVSVGQAEATYNDIVYVNRQDPAFIRRIRGYPESYGTYPFRPNENQFEVKIYPIVRGGVRHVRIFFDCHEDFREGEGFFNLGYPENTVVRVQTGKSVSKLPIFDTGELSITASSEGVIYQIENFGKQALHFSLGKTVRTTAGYSGAVQKTTTGSNFFKVYLDLNKMFESELGGNGKSVTLVWVPSSVNSSSGTNPFEEEKKLLKDYVSTFETRDKLNLLYAGTNVDMFEPHMVPATAKIIANAKTFLNSRYSSLGYSLYHQSFKALVKAFSSIASADTPAVIFCMDRGPMQGGGGPINWNQVDSMKNVLVQINANKARFYAWVHYSKAFFYQRVAQAIQGDLRYFQAESQSYSIRKLSLKEYNFSKVDNVFSTSSGISSFKIELGSAFSNIIKSTPVNGFGLPGVPATSQIELVGQTKADFVLGHASITSAGVQYRAPFVVEMNATEAEGLNLNKLWAFDMVEKFGDHKTLVNSYKNTRNYTLQNPTEEFADLTGTILNTGKTYNKMVDISLDNRVVTMATALLALEPGMELLDEDRFPEEEEPGLAAAAIETQTAIEDSLEIKLSAAPNPFNPTTTIRLKSAGLRSPVSLKIYSPDGRLLRFFDPVQPVTGRVKFSFNATDTNGKRLPTGVYLARAVSGNKTWQTKLMLIK